MASIRRLTGSATAALIVLASTASCASLHSVCTTSYAQAALPAAGSFPGITIDTSSVAATATTNYSASNSLMYPDAIFDYCNVTFAYTHDGRNDRVLVTYWLPAPADFQNRFLATGGGGLAINSGSMSVAGGVAYGAAAGLTDGGFGGFDKQFDSVFLLANGTVNWESVFTFGYEGIHEMTEIGKAFTKRFFSSSSNGTDAKLYSYYQGCSEGGREGWSQVQRFADQFDGAIIGAPAMRYGFQQVNHLYSNAVEKTLDYYPPPCELQKILNLTIAACDSLDGLTDGVVSRTDLCKLHFDLNSTAGSPYYCAASSGGGMGMGGGPGGGGGSSTPAQNGSVTARGAAVASTIIDGLHDSAGKRVYLSYQPSASFDDAATAYSNASHSWTLAPSGLGAEWVSRFLELEDSSSLSAQDTAGLTYDQLKTWMLYGSQRYADTLQTTYPDLAPFRAAGGKVLHYHGESDPSVPAASSVRYHESVRKIMYPDLSYNESVEALGEWYKLFLVPGAAHCATNPLQANGPWPQTNLEAMIDWVERGVEPVVLNATHLAGESKGQEASICAWPLRPFWTGAGNGTMECVYDQTSIDNWNYDFDGVALPVY
ncbi:MAG: hypothetical protein MMC23_005790 [Stictis urceolatum]|nr:hypothetical protein [Stictis urceolata]